jgi:threonine dehydrogenase-like Zn-dependent dehydrogenase
VTGRLAALVGLERIAIQEYELPSVAPGAALLKVRRANVCGSDLRIFHHLSVALRDIVLGHEFVAEVAQLREGLTTDSAGSLLAVGDRIAVVYFHTCRHCPACIGLRRGQVVVVQGAGGLGLYACAVAASSGARVVVVEQQRDRVELARQFGATDALDLSQWTDGRERAARVLDATGGLGADIVLEVTGRAGAFSEAIDFARIGRISWQTTGANTHSAR